MYCTYEYLQRLIDFIRDNHIFVPSIYKCNCTQSSQYCGICKQFLEQLITAIQQTYTRDSGPYKGHKWKSSEIGWYFWHVHLDQLRMAMVRAFVAIEPASQQDAHATAMMPPNHGPACGSKVEKSLPVQAVASWASEMQPPGQATTSSALKAQPSPCQTSTSVASHTHFAGLEARVASIEARLEIVEMRPAHVARMASHPMIKYWWNYTTNSYEEWMVDANGNWSRY
jgi:hypothetical protein